MPKADKPEPAEIPVEIAKPAPAPHLDGLVKMTNGSRVLHVHPTAVASHKLVGWTVL